jgi:hypothetical protein
MKPAKKTSEKCNLEFWDLGVRVTAMTPEKHHKRQNHGCKYYV